MSHPYDSAPARAFWSRAVASSFAALEVYEGPRPLITAKDRVMSAGSCFAANMVAWLERAGLRYLRTESTHPSFHYLPENLGYANFSAAYGNIYTARQLLQLLQRALGKRKPKEDRWLDPPFVIDPYRPGLRFKARSERELEVLTSQHLRAVREAFEQASVFVFTLGLTEAWLSTADGSVFPACPGTVAGTFNPRRHVFHNFTVTEIVDDLRQFVRMLRRVNRRVRVVLTVSPVPLVATATVSHVLAATCYSKSVLRTAAQEVVAHERDVVYFPSYEIVTGPQAPESFFEADRRRVSASGVEAVMNALVACCAGGLTQSPEAPRVNKALELSKAVVEAECEEERMDQPGWTGPRLGGRAGTP